MKHLIVYSHPNPKSFCHAIFKTVTETLKSNSHEVVIRDLYNLNFDPILKASDFVAMQTGNITNDIKEEQNYIIWSDIMTIIHPVWWTGLPAMFKGYIDRVYSHGFAYAIGEKGLEQLLTGKKVIIFNTQGTPKEIYDASGMSNAMHLTSDAAIYQLCGIEVLEHIFFSAVPYVDDATRKAYLEQAKEVMGRY
ncbi:MAG: NAD(P)H-dependent oxidoreductase [Bacteroidia bacterium]|nr:NAD(P)H-dependent oxidoreductase [Bacteroidia bacterium]